MAATSDRLHKLKQSITLSSSSKNIELPNSGIKDSFSMQSSHTSDSIPNSINTIGTTLNSSSPPNTIALDSGAFSIKVGECTDKKPLTNVVPNCILKAKAERKRVFIGNEIDDCRDLSGLYYLLPCDRGYVTRWDLQKTIWTHTVKPYLNDDTTVIMTQPVINFKESQEATDEIFFEEYYIKALCRRYASDYLVFNHMQRHGNDGTCIVVDSGYSSTWIIPYVGGVVYKKGLLRIDIGGKVLTNHMKEILSYRQLNVMEETHVINQMKEDACYVARSFNRDMQVAQRTGPDNTIARTYVLPDFNTIRRGYIADPDCDLATLANSYQLLKLNNERFTVPELLFQPSLAGFQQMGVAEAISHTINRMPEYMQRTLCGNVVLSGGCTKLLGFKNRLGKDLRSLTPSKYAVELFVSADPVTWTWRCAASFSKRSDLNSHCVTRAQYEEYGSKFAYDKFEASWDRDIEPARPTFTEEIRPSLLNYNESVFAVPTDHDTEIIISDTEEVSFEQSKAKVSLPAVPGLSPLSNSNHVQTRSSEKVMNCPPLIITGPSAQAARTVQPRKIHIEQCLSIMGGCIIDQTVDCISKQISTSKQQEPKPLYTTNGKRLFRADEPPSKRVKESSKPRILNSGYDVAAVKKEKPLKKKTFQQPTVLRRSQESKQVLQLKQKHLFTTTRLSPSSQMNINNQATETQVSESNPSGVIIAQATTQMQQFKKQSTETKISLSPALQTSFISSQPKSNPVIESALSSKSATQTSSISKSEQFTASKSSDVSIDEMPSTSKSDILHAPVSSVSQSPHITLKEGIKSKTVAQFHPTPLESQTQPSKSQPQKIILKRRDDPFKQKSLNPVESAETTSSTASAPNALMRLKRISKESMRQLQQVTKVILQPLSQSTLDAATTVHAASATTDSDSSKFVDVAADMDLQAMYVDGEIQIEQCDELVASNSNGVGVRTSRSKRESRYNIVLKKRLED